MFEEITSRCLKCKNARCSQGCPVSTPIPDVMRLLEAGDTSEAGRLLFENNPLSAVCSVVCPHERNCCGHCVRSLKGDGVEFFKIEQMLSRDYLMKYKAPVIVENHKKVAVIGAGPAGITAAVVLRRHGFSVTLIEARDKIGGVLRYGIPDFRLDRAVVDRYETVIREMGVVFKPNTFIGSNATLTDMFTDGYDAIFIAVGTAKPNKLGLLGETLGHAHYAIDYLKSPEAYTLGERVCIVGAGNVALDSARMARRQSGNKAKVTIINNRRECDMTGNKHEIADALSEGVEFLHLLQTVRVTDAGIRCVAVDVKTQDGKPSFDEDFTRVTDIPCDTVIVAIGQGPQSAVINSAAVARTRHGLLDADASGRTSMDGVFAAGDIVTGPKTVVEAVAFAKAAAAEIEKYLTAKA